jgi:5S rRNA maturation endonuclease (ribonuclease M5)
LFTREIILSALNHLGIKAGDTKNNWIKIRCINPTHLDENPSAGIQVGTGIYHCFSCGYKTNIVKIVQNKLLLNSYKEAKDFVLNNSILSFSNNIPRFISEKKPEKKIIKKENNYSLEVTPFNPQDYYYTSIRGFTNDFCKIFNINHCISSTYLDYFITPIQDSKKGIKTFEARKLMQYEYLKKYYKSNRSLKSLNKAFDREKEEKKLKLKKGKVFGVSDEIFNSNLKYFLQTKVLYPPNSNISKTIFNIDNLNFDEPLYLVEGLASVPKIYLNISKNVSAVFGASITEEQLEYLKLFKEIYIIPDNDLAGLQMTKTISDCIKNSFVIPIKTEDTHESYIYDILHSRIVKASRYVVRKANLRNFKEF